MTTTAKDLVKKISQRTNLLLCPLIEVLHPKHLPKLVTLIQQRLKLWENNTHSLKRASRGYDGRTYRYSHALDSVSHILTFEKITPYNGLWFKVYTATWRTASQTPVIQGIIPRLKPDTYKAISKCFQPVSSWAIRYIVWPVELMVIHFVVPLLP